jgi:hypothetical protein
MRARRHTTGRCRRIAALASLAWLAWLALRSTPGLAQAAPVPPAELAACPECADEEQHSGVYLRLSVGLGGTAIEGKVGTAGAFGGSGSFAIGYFILPNLALSLDLFGANAYDVALAAEWEYPASEVDVRSIAAGVSLTYYLPLDFYVSVGSGVGWLMLTTKLAEPQLSGAGFALDALAGREWWIGGSWGLGAGVQFVYVRGDGGIEAVEAAWSLGALFTVTRN